MSPTLTAGTKSKVERFGRKEFGKPESVGMFILRFLQNKYTQYR